MPVAEGGTIEGFKWEIPGMVDWVNVVPEGWSEGNDSIGHFCAYFFNEAPVPDAAGPHRMLLSVTDSETGLLGTNEKAYYLTRITVASGITCWSPGDLISTIPNEAAMNHLNNAKTSFVDTVGIYHVFYIDTSWELHRLTYYDGVLGDVPIMPGELVYNVNAVPDETGGVHLVYADDPINQGGDIIYRYIDFDGMVGDPVILTATSKPQQFQPVLALAPDGTILVLWMDSSSQPTRYVRGAYFNGSGWSPEMTLATCYLPTGWTNACVTVDPDSTYHIAYQNDEPPNLYYMTFVGGAITLEQPLVIADWRSVVPNLSADETGRIYMIFQDSRAGTSRGYFMMRDPISGEWTEEIDLVGFNHSNTRYQHVLLPDGRLAVVWTDLRDGTRGLYSKVFDPFMSEDEIQSIPDDEVDAPYSDPKNQTRLCVDEWGTLHLVWTDSRPENDMHLYYSQCTPK